MSFDGLRLIVVPGDGLVGRFERAVVLIAAGANAEGSVVAEVLRLCGDSSITDGAALAERVEAAVRGAAGSTLPDLFVVVDTGASLRAIVVGEVAGMASGGGPGVDLRAGAGQVEAQSLPAGILQLQAGAAEPGAPADPRLDLTAGIVPGAGFTLLARAAAPTMPASTAMPSPTVVMTMPEAAAAPPMPDVPAAPAATAAAAPAPAAEMPFTVVDVSKPDPMIDRRAPLPIDQPESGGTPSDPTEVMVTGIRCKRQHFNRPDALFCGVCGISTVHETQIPVVDRRPNLGHLVFDDGTVFQLTRDYIVGSNPGDDAAVMQGVALPLSLPQEHAVSPVHASIRLVEWDVYVEDRGSVQGTWVWDGTQWVTAVGQAVPLRGGYHVSVGQRSFRFEAANRR